MTTTDLAVRRDTAVDVPLTDHPEPTVQYVTVMNPHRPHVIAAGLTALAVSGAPALAVANNVDNPHIALAGTGAAVLWFVFALLRWEAFDQRAPEIIPGRGGRA